MCSVEGQSKVTINDLYCTANCLRNGHLFMDALWRVRDAVDYTLVLRRGEPPAGAGAANSRFIAGLLLDPDAPDWVRLRELLQGFWTSDLAIHYYAEARPPNRAKLIDELTQLLIRLIFHSRPAIPISQRWTKC